MIMRLKKTTVLTGNHAANAVNKRNRAQSENEIFTSKFKHALGGESKANNTTAKQESNGEAA